MRRKDVNNLDKLRALMRDMEDSLGIIGDIIGALSLFGLLFVGLFFAGIL
jgi:hypothetical protein